MLSVELEVVSIIIKTVWELHHIWIVTKSTQQLNSFYSNTIEFTENSQHLGVMPIPSSVFPVGVAEVTQTDYDIV